MSSLHDKMYDYEVTPPSRNWDRIAAALDESELQNNFPKRLYQVESTPPETAWENIRKAISPDSDAKPAPVRRLAPLFRYAAAAILIGVVAVGITRFTINNDDNNEAFSSTAPQAVDTNQSTLTSESADEGNDLVRQDDSKVEIDQPASRERPRAVRTVDRPAKREQETVAKAVYTQHYQVDPHLSQSIYAYADYVPDIADRYVMLMTPDGNIIRMSKKWSDLLCCVSGEEQDANCKNQIKKWQEKIASSSLAPAPGNFMDILGLINSINESREL
ncbi:MAG TPA: anti-sigma factor [Chitinophagaceae bacterium]|nr:anti-sigma factor [Chitinophagaceae bacterium]